VVGKVGNVDYKVEMASGNMLKKYYQRETTDDKKHRRYPWKKTLRTAQHL